MVYRWLFVDIDKIFWTKLPYNRIMEDIKNIPVRRNAAGSGRQEKAGGK